MEWLTAVWSKINRPLPLILGGLAIVIFAPSNVAWVGLVSIVLGIAGSVESLARWTKPRLGIWKNRWRLNETLKSLNRDEREVLIAQLKKGEQTFYLNWHDYQGSQARHRDPREYRRLAGIYRGLADKGILWMRTEHTVATMHIASRPWRIMSKRHRKDPNFLAPPTA